MHGSSKLGLVAEFTSDIGLQLGSDKSAHINIKHGKIIAPNVTWERE